MKRRSPPKRRRNVEHGPRWYEMQAQLPVWIVELSKLPGNEIDSALFDSRVESYPETEVCSACKINAAFEIRERLKSYNKQFINLDSSPYLSMIGRTLICTCKRPRQNKK